MAASVVHDEELERRAKRPIDLAKHKTLGTSSPSEFVFGEVNRSLRSPF
jgi:hypothetical protein